jgi:ABC-2 type transport system permease protein
MPYPSAGCPISITSRETGILKRLLVAPTSIYATVIGRSVASGVRAVVQALIIFPVAILLGVKFIANPFYIAAAFLILFLVSGGFAAISILVASIMKTRERFMGLGQALIMPLFFASNALYPIDMMPSALQLFAVLNPLTYAVDAIRGLMISGELSNLTVDVLAILVFDMVVFALASLSFRKILE